MSSTFKNNKPLDFTKNEENSKNNIDYFNLKEDRAKENKQEKSSKCFIRICCSCFHRSICCYNLFLK